ncbi:hypothetical protein FQN55_000277 [Onygenales sp. PD_40]|nr:hypothetical protein FQN55_000277 [Onygenales sp. PD_40]
MSFQYLPGEMIDRIAGFLDNVRDLASLVLVCRWISNFAFRHLYKIARTANWPYTHRTVLEIAVGRGFTRMIDYFLSKQKENGVEIVDTRGKKLWALIATWGNDELKQLLISKQLPGMTELLLAVVGRETISYKQVAIEELYEPIHMGKPILYWAILLGRTYAVTQLLHAGAGTTWDDRVQDPTPAHDPYRNGPLAFAASIGDAYAFNAILKNGAPFDSRNAMELGLLLCAAVRGGNISVLKEVIDMGTRRSDYFDFDFGDGAPLHMATWASRLDMIEILVEKGANVTCLSFGKTVMHIAAIVGDFDAADLFLGQHLDPNVKDWDGQTALHYAMNQDDHFLVELLLANGADIKIKNNNGQTPLAVATSRKIARRLS